MTITTGQISVTPAVLRTNLTLEQLVAEMRRNRYDGEVPSRGWGNLHDEHEELNNRIVAERPESGSPELLPEGAQYPAQIRARFYWDELDKRLLEAWGANEKRRIYNFRMSDVVIVDSGIDGELVVYLCERTESRLAAGLVPAFRDLLHELDPSAELDLSADPLGLEDSDLYLWLLSRVNGAPELDDVVTVTEMRSLTCADYKGRVTVLKTRADMDRNELLALVEDRRTAFGGVKMYLWVDGLELNLDVELDPDGSFAVFRRFSKYEDEQATDRALEGLRLLQDVAYVVIPKVVAAHRRDTAWAGPGRGEFISNASTQLSNRPNV